MKRILHFVVVLSFASGVFAVPPAQAAVLYVSKDSPCPGNGTTATPYCRIQYAFNVALAGDTIRIRDSATPYDESVTAMSSGTSSAPITVESDIGNHPVWTYSGNGSTQAALNILNRDYWTVQNLTFDGTGVPTSRQAVWMSSTNSTQRYGLQFLNNTIKNWGQLVPESHVTGLNIGGDGAIVRGNVFDGIPRFSVSPGGGLNLIVENNEFKNMRCGRGSDGTVSAVGFYLAYGNPTGGTIIRNNAFHDPRPQSECSLPNSDGWTAFGIWTDVGAYNGTIEGNRIWNFDQVTSMGIYLEYDTHGWAVMSNIFYNISYNAIRHHPTTAGAVNTYINNTIYGIGTSNAGWGIQISSGNGVFKNNIIDNSAGAQIRINGTDQSNLTIDYNDYWDLSGGNHVGNWDPVRYNFSDWKTKCQCDQHSINADPQFVKPPSDLGLQSSSPARGTGEGGINMGAFVLSAPTNVRVVQVSP
jgi:hypothetical protein